MPMRDGGGGRGLGALLRDLGAGAAELVRGEARLARIEVREAIEAVGRGTIYVATGAVLALLGTIAIAGGLVLLVGAQWLPQENYWVAALLVALATAAIAAMLAQHGFSALRPSRLAPRETVESLQEDKEWVKQRLKSAGTSS